MTKFKISKYLLSNFLDGIFKRPRNRNVIKPEPHTPEKEYHKTRLTATNKKIQPKQIKQPREKAYKHWKRNLKIK